MACPRIARVCAGPGIWIAVLLLSAAALVVEITLTRIFSLAHSYHFAFVSVSLALLGFGISGSLLALLSPGGSGRPDRQSAGQIALPSATEKRWLPFLPLYSLLFSASVVASYLAANYLPFDSYRIMWEPVQWLYLTVYYGLLSLPFLFAGLFVGAVLSSQPASSSRIYSANLVGSALGSLSTVSALPYIGASGLMSLAAALGLLAALPLLWSRRLLFALLGVASATLIWGAATPFEWAEVRLSPYQSLSQAWRYPGTRLVYRSWSPQARVDVLESRGTRSFPGLSLGYAGSLPPQLALFLDGNGPFPLTEADAVGPDLLEALPAALAYRLISEPTVLLLEPHGNLEGLLAQRQGAGPITVVESNEVVSWLLSERYAEYLGGAFSPPRARLVTESVRSYLARTGHRFGLISLPAGAPFQPVEAGSWALSEDYLYTLEAFREYYDHLEDNGVLLVTRWLQYPPSEELRAWILAAAAVEAAGGDPAQQMMAYRSWSTVSILVSRSPWQPAQIEVARRWLNQRMFDPIYYPGVSPDETNRFNQLPSLAHYELFRQSLRPDRAHLYSTSLYDVSPPADDRPFFHHFFRWSQASAVLERMGKTWQPFGGSGFLLLIGLLVLAILLAASFILGPLAAQPRLRKPVRRGCGPLLYFGLLGLGFMLVEVPMIQRISLVIGYPTQGFAITLLSLLLFSGLGSLVSTRFQPTLACLLVALGAAAYSLLFAHLTSWLLALELPYRAAASIALLAPLGFLMGIPFPCRLTLLGKHHSELVPWAWGVNGFASVVSSVGGAILALGFGFSTVIWLGAAAYGLAAAESLRPSLKVGPRAQIGLLPHYGR